MTTRPRRRAGGARHAGATLRLAALLLAALLGVLGVVSRAEAHGVLRRSEPASGAHLSAAPRELRLTFNEAVEIAVARLELVGPDSVAVALSPLRRGDSASVIVADVVGPLEAGTYTVRWQVVGRDGHPVRDRFRFTIAPGASGLGAPAGAAALADPEPHPGGQAASPPEPHHDPVSIPQGTGFGAGSPAFAAVRWLGFVATLGIVGAIGFGLVVLPAAASPGDDARHRLRALGLGAAAALLVAAGLRLVAQSAAMHGPAGALDAAMMGTMIGQTTWGTAWLIQVAAALLALAGFALLARRRVAGWALASVGALAAALSTSLSGHAAAVPGRAAIAVITDSLHVLAAGGWLGTLLLLTVVGLPVAVRAPAGERGPRAAAMVNAFSPLALACAAVVALTGAISGWFHLGGLGALTSSGYGRTLLLKLAVVALVVATGAWNWRRVRPVAGTELGARRLRRSSTVELAIGVVVLALTAVLVATPTPMDVLD